MREKERRLLSRNCSDNLPRLINRVKKLASIGLEISARERKFSRSIEKKKEGEGKKVFVVAKLEIGMGKIELTELRGQRRF